MLACSLACIAAVISVTGVPRIYRCRPTQIAPSEHCPIRPRARPFKTVVRCQAMRAWHVGLLLAIIASSCCSAIPAPLGQCQRNVTDLVCAPWLSSAAATVFVSSNTSLASLLAQSLTVAHGQLAAADRVCQTWHLRGVSCHFFAL
jgi:hypothetical protein